MLYPPSLANLEKRLFARLNTLDSAFNRSLFVRSSARRSDRSFLQEGLVSSLWQTWCWAVRTLIIQSVRGANTKQGGLTMSPYANLQENQLTYIASRRVKNQEIGTVKSLGSHLEPTWGDLNKIGVIAMAYGLSNGSQLASALASPSSVVDLQTCRNACAHLNSDRLKDVTSAKTRYSETKFMHPSDMMFWVEPTSGDFLWRAWTGDIRLAYGLAVQ